MLAWRLAHQALKVCDIVCIALSRQAASHAKFRLKCYITQVCDAGSFRLPYFPAEAVFVVTRNGSKIGFRSLG